MPTATSAQAAELIALTRACTLAEGKTATIYTDSRYVFGVCHAVGVTWKSHEFLTSAGTPFANGHIIAALLQIIHLSSKIAIVHYSAHTKETDTVSLGNNRSDRAAKYAVQNGPPYPFSTQFLNLPLSLTDVNYQANALQSEKDKWIEKGAK